MTKSQQALQNMIASQMLPNEVTDPSVLAALTAVSREFFAPPAFKNVAYADENIPLTDHRVMMKPFVFARLVQLAGIKPSDHVLHIATGTGYGSAVLKQLAGHVMATESHHGLAETARKNLRECDVEVEVFTTSLTVGYPLSSPYDVIFIEGAIQCIPGSLAEQVKEGGCLVAVKNVMQRLDAPSGLGKALLARKVDGKLHHSVHFDASVPLLPGFEKKEEFIF